MKAKPHIVMSGEPVVRGMLFGLPGFQCLEVASRDGHMNFQTLEKSQGAGASCFQTLETGKLLELVLEPFYVLLSQWTDGAVRYPADQLDELWKGLLENRNDVHGLQDLHDELIDLYGDGMDQLTQRISRADFEEDDYLLTVVNPLPYERTEAVEALLCPRAADGYGAFGLCDEEGRSIDFDLLETDDIVGGNDFHEHLIRFRLNVPPCGYRTLRLFRCDSLEPLGKAEQPIPKEGWTVQNEFMRVTVGSDGQVDLLDSETGIESTGLFDFEGVDGVPEVVLTGRGSVWIRYPFGVSLTLSLRQGSRHLVVQANVDNSCKIEPIRLWVRTDVHSDESWGSQPFNCVRQATCLSHSQFNDGLVSVRDWNHQFSIFSDNTCEYEHLCDKRGTIALIFVKGGTYRLGMRPGKASEAALMREMQCFQVPLCEASDAVDRTKFNLDNLPENEQILPLKKKGLALDSSMVFSTLKRSFARDAWVLRFFNPSEQAQRAELVLPNAEVSDLDERKGEEHWTAGTVVESKKVVTLRFN